MSEPTSLANDAYHRDKCLTCKHSAADPGGAFCGHPESFKGNIFGQGITKARSSTGVCGPDAKLYEQCLCEKKHCPRHQGRHLS